MARETGFYWLGNEHDLTVQIGFYHSEVKLWRLTLSDGFWRDYQVIVRDETPIPIPVHLIPTDTTDQTKTTT